MACATACYGDPNQEWGADRNTAIHILILFPYKHFLTVPCFVSIRNACAGKKFWAGQADKLCPGFVGKAVAVGQEQACHGAYHCFLSHQCAITSIHIRQPGSGKQVSSPYCGRVCPMERMRQIFRPDFHFGDSERQKADYRDQSAAEEDIIEE
jgi:hypothetical protein